MLFPERLWPGLADGSITLTFRPWTRARARVGSRHTTPAGVLLIEAVDVVPAGGVRDDEARRAGFRDRAHLCQEFGLDPDDEVHRIAFRHVGADPRIALRERPLQPDEVPDILTRLDRMDARAAGGPWTRATLAAIADRPEVRAGDLATALGRERLAFKTDVRKLKALGLTESLEIGYRLSPRGRSLLDALDRP